MNSFLSTNRIIRISSFNIEERKKNIEKEQYQKEKQIISFEDKKIKREQKEKRRENFLFTIISPKIE
ncbi:hypothetical protein [Candidatus Phytoplasma oryzae]|nr:hypothetical protein [Candidatus Phytoplasma oryzae]